MDNLLDKAKEKKEVVKELKEKINVMENKNVYQKLAEARVRLQNMDLKKSGENKFSKFKYYELADLLPAINSINEKLKLLSLFNFDNEKATLKIIDTESNNIIEFTLQTVQAQMKGANPIQELGATNTYLKRYLYLNAYEIQESDIVDGIEKEKHDTEKREEKSTREKATHYITSNLEFEELEKELKHYKVDTLEKLNEAQLKELSIKIKNMKK